MSNFSAPAKTLGVRFATVDATQLHELGHRMSDELGNEYVYVLASGAIAANKIVSIDGGYSVAALAAAGVAWAVAPVAIADTKYGWVQTKGMVTANVADSTADNAALGSITDSNGDLYIATETVAGHGVFAKNLSTVTAGLALVYIL